MVRKGVMKDDQTYSDGKLLSNPGRDEPQYQPPHGNAHPKPCRCHAACKVLALPHLEHELDNPAAERDFDADVPQEEDRTAPRHPCVGQSHNRFFHAVVLSFSRARICSAECCSIRLPECSSARTKLDERQADHNVVERVPREVALGDHGGSNEGRQHSAEAVEGMQEAQNLIGVRHVANPGVPGGVRETVAEACDGEDDDEHRVGRVHRNHDIWDQVADWG